jgi:hypothetical protein
LTGSVENVDIYIAKGTYLQDTLTLAQGISFFGGYNGVVDNWRRRDLQSTTRIISQSSVALKTVPFTADQVMTTLQLLTISTSASSPSSHAIILNGAKNMTLSRLTVISSLASTGSDSETAAQGENGGTGFRGGAGCENGGAFFCVQSCNQPFGGGGGLSSW